MIMNVYAVFDRKAAVFATPIFLPNEAVAVRSFEDACTNPASQLSKHHEDYAMYCIGSYDDNSGELVALDKPKLVVSASQIVSMGSNFGIKEVA